MTLGSTAPVMVKGYELASRTVHVARVGLEPARAPSPGDKVLGKVVDVSAHRARVRLGLDRTGAVLLDDASHEFDDDLRHAGEFKLGTRLTFMVVSVAKDGSCLLSRKALLNPPPLLAGRELWGRCHAEDRRQLELPGAHRGVLDVDEEEAPAAGSSRRVRVRLIAPDASGVWKCRTSTSDLRDRESAV